MSVCCLLALMACGNKPQVSKHSSLTLPAVLGNGMVLQQNSQVNIWGMTNPHAQVTVMPSWDGKSYPAIAGGDGAWTVKIPTPEASKQSYELRVSDSYDGLRLITDVRIGEVWLFSGQSNMDMPMRGFGSVANGNYQPITDFENELASGEFADFRYFEVKTNIASEPQFHVKENVWQACTPEKAREFSAIAFFTGRELSKSLNIPIGIICVPYGGTRIEAWMPLEVIEAFDRKDYTDAAELGDPKHKSAPGVLYNGMIHPIAPYTIKGIAWCQGESNRDNAAAYPRLQAAMVQSWRAGHGDSDNALPFYYVQMAPLKSSDDKSTPELIEAQVEGQKLIPNSRLVCTSDLGSLETIHYPNKRPVGERLAALMQYEIYGNKSIPEPYSPLFKSVRTAGPEIIAEFDHAHGLHAKGPIEYLEVAGSDGTYHAAQGRIEGGKLIAHSPMVPAPKNMRYCFHSWHVSTIYNASGLPLHPFRSCK